MTMITRWAPMLGAICTFCVANTSLADGDSQRLRLLQLQTLNRIAPHAAPTRNNASNDNNGRRDRGADGSPASARQSWHVRRRADSKALACVNFVAFTFVPSPDALGAFECTVLHRCASPAGRRAAHRATSRLAHRAYQVQQNIASQTLNVIG
ncbi:MAG TPA: hypothetical protein VF573_21585 [Paraburkholderia sp.]|uniref:hypothetical protein n=1 Tax=Paraburkholderia sp. TaxID=1926495 RepID=UPI002ECFB62D